MSGSCKSKPYSGFLWNNHDHHGNEGHNTILRSVDPCHFLELPFSSACNAHDQLSRASLSANGIHGGGSQHKYVGCLSNSTDRSNRSNLVGNHTHRCSEPKISFSKTEDPDVSQTTDTSCCTTDPCGPTHEPTCSNLGQVSGDSSPCNLGHFNHENLSHENFGCEQSGNFSGFSGCHHPDTGFVNHPYGSLVHHGGHGCQSRFGSHNHVAWDYNCGPYNFPDTLNGFGDVNHEKMYDLVSQGIKWNESPFHHNHFLVTIENKSGHPYEEHIPTDKDYCLAVNFVKGRHLHLHRGVRYYFTFKAFEREGVLGENFDQAALLEKFIITLLPTGGPDATSIEWGPSPIGIGNTFYLRVPRESPQLIHYGLSATPYAGGNISIYGGEGHHY